MELVNWLVSQSVSQSVNTFGASEVHFPPGCSWSNKTGHCLGG